MDVVPGRMITLQCEYTVCTNWTQWIIEGKKRGPGVVREGEMVGWIWKELEGEVGCGYSQNTEYKLKELIKNLKYVTNPTRLNLEKI